MGHLHRIVWQIIAMVRLWAAVQFRNAARYLTPIVAVRVVMAQPTIADIMAQAHGTSFKWRTESLGCNAFAGISVESIGVDIVGGRVADCTVKVTNQDCSFYVGAVSRATAVRMALQGGLASFAQGITYDVAIDKYVSTTAGQLVPMLKAIMDAAPADNTGNAIDHYLGKWNEILWEVYPDYVISGGNTLLGGAMAFDQAFILQQVIAAFEASSIHDHYDIRGVAHNLAVDDAKIITPGVDVAVAGTAKTDFFYITPGNHTYTGGAGSDFYFVGKNSGDDTIVDYGVGDTNELIFTSLNMADVEAAREGEDLLLTVKATGKVIRVKDQFLGELNERRLDGKQIESGVNAIVFADGTIWDRTRMAFQVSHAVDGDISVLGSGSAANDNTLWKANAA